MVCVVIRLVVVSISYCIKVPQRKEVECQGPGDLLRALRQDSIVVIIV